MIKLVSVRQIEEERKFRYGLEESIRLAMSVGDSNIDYPICLDCLDMATELYRFSIKVKEVPQ